MFAEKNPAAWSDLLDFLAERIAADIFAERAQAGATENQSKQSITEPPCVH